MKEKKKGKILNVILHKEKELEDGFLKQISYFKMFMGNFVDVSCKEVCLLDPRF